MALSKMKTISLLQDTLIKFYTDIFKPEISNFATITYVNETVANSGSSPDYGPYSIQYNSNTNSLDFIYTVTE